MINVKNNFFMAVFVCLCGAGCLFAAQVNEIETDKQLTGDSLKSKLVKMSPEYRDSIWPGNSEIQNAISLSDIPQNVLDEAENWTKRIIREQWRPESIKDNFIALRRKAPYLSSTPEIDYLIVRYEMEKHNVQILEKGYAISVLFAPLDKKKSLLSLDEFMKESVKKYLNIPEEKIEKIEFYLKSDNLVDGTTLYFGTMDIQEKEEWEFKIWWNHIYFWTDLNMTYFNIVEMDPIRAKKTQAIAGVPPRFPKKKKNSENQE